MLDRRSVLKLLSASTAMAVAPDAGLSQSQGGTVVMLVQPDVPNLASYLSSALPTALVATKIYDGLLEYGFDLKPRPGLAESWEVAPDGRTVTFKIRRGVKFHDGGALTSADVKFSIMDILKKYHTRGPINFQDLTDIETPDEHTAVFRLSNPAPYMLMSLSGYEAPIVPKRLFEGTDVPSNKHANEPVGTGPFVFKEWRRGQYIRLDRNPNYWKPGRPHVDRLVLRYIPDAGTRTASVENGEVQLAGFGAIYYPDVRRLQSLPSLTSTTKGYEMISPIIEMHFNTPKAPFDNVKVRQALSYAMDRQFIIDHIWFGYGRKATGPINSNFSASGLYTSDVRSYDVPDRMEVAKRLLDEAGFPPKADGTRFEMVVDATPYGEEWRRFGEYVQQTLGQLGIKARLRYEDVPTWLRRIYTDYDFDLTLTWVSNLADPVTGIHREYHSKSIRKGAVFVNASRWSSPETDALMNSGTIEPDSTKRAKIYHEFQKRVVEAAPTIWISELQFSTVHAKNLQDVVVSPLGLYANLDSMRLAI